MVNARVCYGCFSLVVVLWLARADLAMAQVDPFESLDEAADASGIGCDETAAKAASNSFLIFTAVIVVLAALLGVGIWWLMEHKGWWTGTGRTLISPLVVGLIGFDLVTWRPWTPEAQLKLMENTACTHLFPLGAAGFYAQGVVLGLLPTVVLGLILIVIARKIF